MSYRFLADVILVVHMAWVAFVTFGLPVILIGRALGWQWIGNRWFRGIHLAMIAIVVLRTLIWQECPLTWWERDLRAMAGQEDFEGAPITGCLNAILHPVGVPLWVFPILYAIYGTLIVASLWLAPVRWRTTATREEARPTSTPDGAMLPGAGGS